MVQSKPILNALWFCHPTVEYPSFPSECMTQVQTENLTTFLGCTAQHRQNSWVDWAVGWPSTVPWRIRNEKKLKSKGKPMAFLKLEIGTSNNLCLELTTRPYWSPLFSYVAVHFQVPDFFLCSKELLMCFALQILLMKKTIKNQHAEPKIRHMELLIVSVKYHCTCRKKGSHSIHEAEPEVDILFGKLLQLMLQLLCLFFLLWRLPKKLPPPLRLLFEFNYLPHLLPIIYWFCEAFIHIHSILAKSHHSGVTHNHQLNCFISMSFAFFFFFENLSRQKLLACQMTQ